MAGFDGTITTSASEQSLFDVTGDKFYTTTIFLHNMTSTETFDIKIYLYDTNGAAYRLAWTITVSGAQDYPAHYIAPLASSQFKVTIQRIAGTDRAVTWKRFETAA